MLIIVFQNQRIQPMDTEELKKQYPDQAIIVFAIPKEEVAVLDSILCDLRDDLKHQYKQLITQIIKAL